MTLLSITCPRLVSFAIRRAKKSDMEALSKATGGRVVTNMDDLTS